MAQRRMFNRAITESDAFIEMPMSAQALYFHLGMDTDDDGFVVSPKRTQRALGAAEDDLRILVAKGFLIEFDTGVLAVTHHKTHNTLRNDRYKPTIRTMEYEQLRTLPSGAYELPAECALPDKSLLETTGTPVGNQVESDGFPNITEHNPTEPNQDDLSDKSRCSSTTAEVVDYLNQRTGRCFRPTTKVTAKHISARIAEGYRIEDFKRVIDLKSAQWESDPNMSRYLRPETLFGPKFESYLNEMPCKEVSSYDKYDD